MDKLIAELQTNVEWARVNCANAIYAPVKLELIDRILAALTRPADEVTKRVTQAIWEIGAADDLSKADAEHYALTALAAMRNDDG